MEEIGILDLLNIFSLWTQVNNINIDKRETEYIHKIIKAIANEIDKLHKENDIIIGQNEKILRLLGEDNDFN